MADISGKTVATSKSSGQLTLHPEPEQTTTVEYNIYDLNISGKATGISQSSGSLTLHTVPEQTVDVQYKIVDPYISGKTTANSKSDGQLTLHPIPEQNTEVKYNIYTLNMSGKAISSSKSEGDITLHPVPEQSAAINYNVVFQPYLEFFIKGRGEIDPEPGQYFYDEGEEVDIEAIEKEDSMFAEWEITEETIETFDFADPAGVRNYYWRGYLFQVNDIVNLREIYCGASYDPDEEDFFWGLYRINESEFDKDDPWNSLEISHIVENDNGEKLFGDCPTERRGRASEYTDKDIEVLLFPGNIYCLAQGRVDGNGQHYDIEDVDIEGMVEKSDIIKYWFPDQEEDYWDDMEPQQAVRFGGAGDENTPIEKGLETATGDAANTAPDMMIEVFNKLEFGDKYSTQTYVIVFGTGQITARFENIRSGMIVKGPQFVK